MHGLFCLVRFYILTTSKAISSQVLICDSTHFWPLYSASPLGDQTVSTMTGFLTQSHYPDNGQIHPCPNLLMTSTRLASIL